MLGEGCRSMKGNFCSRISCRDKLGGRRGSAIKLGSDKELTEMAEYNRGRTGKHITGKRVIQ